MSDLERKAISLDFGQYGYDEVTSGGSVSTSDNPAGYYAVVARNGSAQIDVTSLAGDSSSNVVLLQGETAYGSWSSISVDSGTVWAYRR